MKRETRGRKTRLGTALTKRICALLAKGLDQKSACNLAKIPYSTYNEWKARGQNGEEPFASFFSVTSRARDYHKSRLLKIVLDAAEGLLPRHADWKAASWLLEKGWPLEYGDRRPLPIPLEEPPATIPVTFVATLPSGRKADLDEIMRVVREQREAAVREPIKNEPPAENEPMTYRYDRTTKSVVPSDNGDGED